MQSVLLTGVGSPTHAVRTQHKEQESRTHLGFPRFEISIYHAPPGPMSGTGDWWTTKRGKSTPLSMHFSAQSIES
jgi:hypothetical protein